MYVNNKVKILLKIFNFVGGEGSKETYFADINISCGK